MSIDSQIQTFIEDQEDTIPEYLKPLFVQQDNFINTTQGEGVSEDVYGIDPNYDYSQTSLARGIIGVLSAVGIPFGSLAIDKIDPTVKFNPLKAAINAIEAFGKPRDPNETLGERYGSLIEESKRSDPNRDVAYGALGTKNSYSLPGTSFTLGISDEDVLGLTREEAEKNLNVTEFQSTNTQAQRDQAEEDASTVGVGTAAAAAAARGASRPSTDYGFGEMGSSKDASEGRDTRSGGSFDDQDQGGGTGGTGGLGDVGTEGFGADTDAAGLNTGGRIGALIQHLQTGGDVENAETDYGSNANVPMGVVDDPDGAPSPFSGGTGVEDDLDMDVEAGSYVLNAEAVQLIGISDINAVIRDAYSIAAALGKPMPQDYDPQNKVPIRISNGEAVIPKSLVDIIGLDKLEKWNQKGLQLRKQKEEFMAQQQQQQPPQGPQVAAEAPMQQQMGQLMAKGGEAYNVLSGKDELPEEMEERAKKVTDAGDYAYKVGKTIKDHPTTILEYAGKEVADLAGFTVDDQHRSRKIWDRYHGPKASADKHIQYMIHQNLYGKAPKEKKLQDILSDVVNDYRIDSKKNPDKGDQGISINRLKDSLYRVALHESLGGAFTRQQVNGKSVGVARGWWQVEPPTAMSMIFSEGVDQGFIGPKVKDRLEKLTGKTFKELQDLIVQDTNSKELKFKTSKGRKFFIDLLENKQEFNATMASINMLVKLKNKKDLDLIKE